MMRLCLPCQVNSAKPLQGVAVQTENVPAKLHLSAGICYFSGASVYDIILMHGMGRQTVYDSVYGVVNAINNTNTLSFNVSFEFTFLFFSFLTKLSFHITSVRENGAEFPSFEDQWCIAQGFEQKSSAGFDKIIMALDGMLIRTIQPTK